MLETPEPQAPPEVELFTAPTSMRDVEPSAHLWLRSRAGRAGLMAGRPRRGGGVPQTPFQRPAGTLRRSQVVRTNGPGAMLDLVDHAVMVAGLDFWRYQKVAEHVISLPRLRDRLAPRFEEAGRPLDTEGCFRLPPLEDEKKATPDSGIEVLELPRWFVCQNPDCRALVRADGLETRGGSPRSTKPRERRRRPSRERASTSSTRSPTSC